MKTAQQTTLEKFLYFLIAGEYKKAFELTQKTWQEGKTHKVLEAMFTDRKINGSHVRSWTNFSDVLGKFSVSIEFDTGEKIISDVNVICESWPYKTDPFGDWGVNPISLLNPIEVFKDKEPEAPQKPEAKKQAPKRKPVATRKPRSNAKSNK